MSAGLGNRMLAAVHLPKTAGTSFREALQRAFGDGLRLDYDDRPLAHGRWARRMAAVRHAAANAGRHPEARCVYGHYLPLKYATMRRVGFCVWLRDPVQRVLSRYHHHQRHAGRENWHERWGLAAGMDLEQFVRLPHYQDTCAEYLWMFPLHRFDFIGIVEDYDAELERFGARFGLDPRLLAGESRNRNPHKAEATYRVEPAMQRLIRSCNARDVALYERALDLAAKRGASI